MNSSRAAQLFALILVFAVVSLAPAAWAGSSDKPITLRYAHFLHKNFNWFTATDKFFAKEVEKRTKGKVKVKIYWAESLGKTAELLELVRGGTVDIASMYVAVFPSAFPIWSAPNSLFFVMTNLDEPYQLAIQAPGKIPGIQKEFRKQNVKLLYHHLLPSYHLWAKKPITKFEDLRGLKLRSFGVHLPKIYKAAGAVGVTVLHPEVYESIQRGVIDGGMFPLPLAQGLKLQEVAKDVSLWDLGSIIAYGAWMNIDKWNKLPPDIRKSIGEAAKSAGAFAHEHSVKMESKIKEQLKKAGVKFPPVPAAERQKWIDASPNFLNEWVKNMEKLSKEQGETAKQLRTFWLEIVKKY